MRVVGALVLGCFVCSGGCMVGPDYHPPQTTMPAEWTQKSKEVVTTRPADVAVEWWKTLKDPTLDSLIERSLASNLDLQIASARIREARAARMVAAAPLFPTLDASGAYSYRGSSRNAGPKVKGQPSFLRQQVPTIAGGIGSALGQAILPGSTSGTGGGTSPASLLGSALRNLTEPKAATTDRALNLFQGGFDASWELDIFGGTRRAVEAADANIAATEDARRGVLVTLLSEVAVNYVLLRGGQRQLAIAQENITSQRDTLLLTESRFEGGLTSELDVAQARAQLSGTRATVPVFETNVRLAAHRLAVLTGQQPTVLLGELMPPGTIPPVPPSVPVGLPSELLRRRPDIRQAERLVAAATAEIGVATADLFPRIALTGTIGPQTRDIRHFFDAASMAWSVGPGVSWPIFQGGAIRGNIEIRGAQAEQAMIAYESAVLIALEETENALVAYAQEIERHQLLGEAVGANRRALALANERYTRGLADFLSVLESQRSLYVTQAQLIESEQSVTADLISLYKALGGGWEPAYPAGTAESAPACD